MQVQSYLFFNGNCGEALDFYEKALGARVDMRMTFKEAPEPPPPDMVPADWGDKILHASFTIGETMVMASDGCDADSKAFSGFSLSLAVKTGQEADRCFDALSDGGQVTMPLGQTFWSPRFGMLKDRFGVSWMVNVVTECGG